jgi:hypothetical protein
MTKTIYEYTIGEVIEKLKLFGDKHPEADGMTTLILYDDASGHLEYENHGDVVNSIDFDILMSDY